MFSLIGALLLICGLVTASNAEMYKRSLDININLYWGLLLLAFGATMVTLAWRDAQKAKQVPSSPSSSEAEELASRK